MIEPELELALRPRSQNTWYDDYRMIAREIPIVYGRRENGASYQNGRDDGTSDHSRASRHLAHTLQMRVRPR